MDNYYELVVIGGGTAGLVCVDEALMLGCRSIALIEKEKNPGGNCAHYACVPTKTMVEAASLLKDIKTQSGRYGIRVQEPELDMHALARTVTEIAEEKGDTVCDSPYVDCYQGEARFMTSQALDVNGQVIVGGKIIIATGSRPVIPDIDGLQEAGFMTFQQASRLEQLPNSLIILGGSVVGVEFAQIFQTLGCQVTLVEQGERLIKGEEPEISALLADTLKRIGVKVHLQCEVIRAERNGERIQLITEDDQRFEAAQLLLAVGMQPLLDNLNLEIAGVEFNRKGITIDSFLRTSNPDIYAVGDVAGPYRLTSTGDYQAVLAARNALVDAAERLDYRAVGWAIYTLPTIAHVGLTEQQAREQYANIRILTAKPDEVSRYRIEAKTEGLIKLIVDADTHCLLGAHIMATQSDDMAHFLMLAIQSRIPIYDFQDMAFIYPSRAQLIQKAIEKYPVSKEKRKLAETVQAVSGSRTGH